MERGIIFGLLVVGLAGLVAGIALVPTASQMILLDIALAGLTGVVCMCLWAAAGLIKERYDRRRNP